MATIFESTGGGTIWWVKLASRIRLHVSEGEMTEARGNSQRSRKKVPAFFYDSSGTLERGTQDHGHAVKGRTVPADILPHT